MKGKIIAWGFVFALWLAMPRHLSAKAFDWDKYNNGDTNLSSGNVSAATIYSGVISATKTYETVHVPGQMPAARYWYDGHKGTTWSLDMTVSAVMPPETGYPAGQQIPGLTYYPDWPDMNNEALLTGRHLQSVDLGVDRSVSVKVSTICYAGDLVFEGLYTIHRHGREKRTMRYHIIHIRVPDLLRLPPDEKLYLMSASKAIKAETHYGNAKLLSALKTVANVWAKKHPDGPLLEIGDISLPLGGVFDPGQNCNANTHAHSFGLAADIGKANLSDSQSRAALNLLCKNGFAVYSIAEGDTAEHFHAVYREAYSDGKKAKWPLELDNVFHAVDCCQASPGTAEYSSCVKNR